MSDEEGEWLPEDACNALQEIRADLAARSAAFDDACDMADMDAPPAFHRHVAARFESMGDLTELSISPVALAGYTHTELTDIVTEVLRRTRQHVLERMAPAMSRLREGLDETVTAMLGERERARPDPAERIFMETSRDGDLNLALGNDGRLLWCDIGPHTTAATGAADLSDRIIRLHTLARMRISLALAEKISAEGAEGSDSLPTAADVEAYRRQHITF